MKDYCGWRARIGVIYMASSIVLEPEFYAMAPDGVSVHTDRIILPKVTLDGLAQMMEGDEVLRCTTYLAKAPLNVILFGGTSATFMHGRGWDEAVMKRMREVSNGIPVTTTSSASLAALHSLGARKISIVTPYLDSITERAVRFFSENGLEVLSFAGMNIDEDHAIGAVPLEEVYQFARRNTHPGAEALFLSCTNWRTVGAIEALEQDLGIPVVSAIQSSFWQSLRMAGVNDQRTGFGSLFRLGGGKFEARNS